MVTRPSTRVLVISAIALAGPSALGLDLVARHFLFQNQPANLRQFMAENVTHYAWFIVPLPLLGGLIGFFLYPSMRRSNLARLGPSPAPMLVQGADLKTLLLTTTCAQLPALFGDVSVMLGGDLAPAICATSISVLAVLAIGARSMLTR